MQNKLATTEEQKWYSLWEKSGYFKPHASSEGRPSYSLLMPPPNLTGEPHCGHTTQHLILDALARFKRLQGYRVLFLPGVDHAGIQFEATFAKALSKKGESKHTLGREVWLQKAEAFKNEVYTSFHTTWRTVGISADWSQEVFTLDDKVKQAVLQQFQTFWDEGLLYKGAYIVQWCAKCGTAIEDVEMEYEERTEELYYVSYALVDQPDEKITVATARPETIIADTGIAFFPHHPKYESFAGLFAKNPLTNEKIPLFADERVDKTFGTGALKITPGHDVLDYAIGVDHHLPILHAVDKTGRMTTAGGVFSGEKIMEARKKAVDLLKEVGALEKTETYTHSVPVCERCKTTIEPLISTEWFVKMQPIAKKAIPELKKIRFIPAHYQDLLSSWMQGIHDWSISRSLWWGHRIPVWYCMSCNTTQDVGSEKGMTISLDEPKAACSVCGRHEWVQDEQILDTWFSSGLWPLATLGWPHKDIQKTGYFPWSFEISAPEIKYLWIARMIMLSVYFTDTVPFLTMFFNGTLRDTQGRKFSKSLGNGLYPQPFIDQWGTDALRMALFSFTAPARDGKASKQILDERCKNYRNFVTKLRNITHFVIDLRPAAGEAVESVGWEQGELLEKQLQELIVGVTLAIEQGNLHLATEQLYGFVWHTFADIFIEQAKADRKGSQAYLERALRVCLVLLHPFMPFTTEELYQRLPEKKESIMLEVWPGMKDNEQQKGEK